MTAYRHRWPEPQGASGLGLSRIIVQSAACHPDWTAETHLGYLYGEEGVDASVIDLADVEAMLPACRRAAERMLDEAAQA